MIKVSYFAVAYLENNNKTLMMKRNNSFQIASNLWAAVGGHIESNEFRYPEVSCYREIFEETGICKDDISELKLTHILMRLKSDEIRIQYIFRGKTNILDLSNCDEGSLHWISNEDLINLKSTFTTQETIIEFQRESQNDSIKIGVVEVIDNIPRMKWSTIEDWDNSGFI